MVDFGKTLLGALRITIKTNSFRTLFTGAAASLLILCSAAQGATNTTTLLTLSSPSVAVGTPVGLSAMVSDQSGAPVGKGTILFCNAAAAFCSDVALLGSAQLTANGTASIKVSLGVGTYSIKAVFVGTNSASGSTSALQALTVADQVGTSTSLAVTGPDNTFTLTATVTGGGHLPPSGSVTFTDTTWNTPVATSVLDPTTTALVLRQVSSYPTPEYGITVTAVCDLNGDGKLDLVVTDYYGQVTVLIGNGDGTFQVLPSFFAGANVSSGGSVIADVNGDSRPDLVVAGGANNSVLVLLGNGDGTFQSPRTVAVGYATASVAVGDLNGDGILDLVTGNGSNQGVSVLLGNGDGTFQAPITDNIGTVTGPIVVADFNHDGKIDVVAAGELLIGNGDGTFQPQVSAGSAKLAADLNRDGNLDLIGVPNGYQAFVMLGNGDGTFQPIQWYGVGGNTYDVAIGDFNSDGIPDLVTLGVNNNQPVIGIFPGKGDGTFLTPTVYPQGLTSSYVAVGDFNGDGSPDLVIAATYFSSPNSSLISVLQSYWSVQAAATPISLQGVGNHPLVAAYGGDTTFVASNSAPVNVVHGVSTALTVSASPSTQIDTGQSIQLTATLSPNTYNGVTAGGTVTFLDGQNQIGQQSVNGAGQATITTSPLSSGYHQITAVYGGDTNFAPVQGLVTLTVFVTTTTSLNASSNNVTVGTPVLFTATVTDQFGVPVTAGQVVLCDATAIHCQDAAVFGTAQLTSSGTATLNLRLGPGNHSLKAVYLGTQLATGSSSAAQSVSVSGQVPTITSWARTQDAQHNTVFQANVFGSGQAPPTGTVLFNDTTNQNLTLAKAALDPSTAVLFPENSYRFLDSSMAVQPAVADFNRDGIPDLVIIDPTNHGIGIMLGNGDGSFQSPSQIFDAGSNPVRGTIGDFNGDGKMDVLIVDELTSPPYTTTLAVLLGNGDGTFQAAQFVSVAPGSNQLAVGDFNTDGKLDLAITNLNSNSIDVMVGNGDGSFQAATAYAVGQQPISLVVADFNGDGKPDLAVTNSGDSTLGILLGNGDGSFQAQTTFTANNQPIGLAVGDFNNDGKPDLVITNSPQYISYTLGVFIGNGDGTFQPQQPYNTNYFSSAVAVGDVNGDGKLDLVIDGDYALSVLLGNGDGTFQAKQSYPVLAGPTGGILVADLNGDGKPDLMTPTWQATFSVLLNGWGVQGSTPEVLVPGQGETHAVVAAYSGDSVYPASTSRPVDLNSYSMALGSLNPASVFVGSGSFTLAVGGYYFVSGAVVQWGGTPLSTTFVDSSDLTAIVPASEVDAAGMPNITVVFGQASSNPYTLQVVNPYGTVATPTSLAISAPGGNASATITLSPAIGYSGTVNLACSVVYNGQGTAHEAPTCSLSQSQTSLSATTQATVTVSVSTTAPHVATLLPEPRGGGLWFAYNGSGAGIFLAGALIFMPRQRRSRGSKLHRVMLIGLFAIVYSAFLLLQGCGGGGGNNPTNGGTTDPGTSTGNYTVNITASAGNYTSSVALPLTVQ
jgi:hypothetical protein